MTRTTLEVGLYAVNCSILAEGDRAWIVDPGADGDRILRALADRRLTPAGILLTHAHFDHIGAVAALQKRFPALPVYVHPADESAFGHPFNQLPPDYPSAPRPQNMCDARTFAGARVIETPGHTPGGVCYLFGGPSGREGLLFSGDTLFAGSAGRTDFPGGDMSALIDSLRKLATLPDDTRVIPGHGPETTIGAEKGNNPFLKPLL